MYDCNSDYGESCYRLLARNGNFIYLQTKGYLEIDKETNKVHSFVCVNTLMNEEDGRRKVQEMKDKFSVIIQTKVPSNSMQDVPASQNPQQLERIVLYLIENLQKRHENSSESPSTSAAAAATTNASSSMMGQQSAIQRINAGETEASGRFAKTPPLALVPPETSSVKTIISKSVSVINVTVGKNLQHQNSIKARRTPPESRAETTSASNNNNVCAPTTPAARQEQPAPQRASVLQMFKRDADTEMSSSSVVKLCQQQQQKQELQQKISVLKRLNSSSHAKHYTSIVPPPAKRTLSIPFESPPSTSRLPSSAHAPQQLSTIASAVVSTPAPGKKELHTVLSTSLQEIENTLNAMGKNAHELCEQHSNLLPTVVMPKAFNNKLDAIMCEHQSQTTLYGHIKREYGEHMQEEEEEQQGTNAQCCSRDKCHKASKTTL